MKKILVYISIVIVTIVSLILIFGFFIDPYILKTNEIKIVNSNITDNWNGLKIVHISDIQYTNNMDNMLKKVLEEVNLIKPDIILITGDTLYSNDDTKELIDFLNNMNANLGKYIIKGDNDLLYSFDDVISKTDFIVLDDNSKLIFKDSLTPILISGISSSDIDKIEEKWMKLEKTYDKNLNTCLKILLIHEPDYIDKIDKSEYDLILSGHSIGGVNLPFIKRFATLDNASNYIYGEYNIGKTTLYVSNGISNSYLKFRFMNKPSINFYRIVK